MALLNDGEVTDWLISTDKKRFDYFIPNYLVKLLEKKTKICSAGCGMAYDVEKLNQLGFDAYGFDPGSRTQVWDGQRSSSTLKKLRVASSGDPALKEFDNFFDYVYSLEVIEHVGTEDGIWKLKSNYIEERIKFLESCLDILQDNGKLLISTSNRLCPIDLGHGHHYNAVTDFFSRKLGINLTNPLSSKNFVCSYSDIKKYLNLSKYKNRYSIKAISTNGYSSNSKSGRNRGLVYLFNRYLKMANFMGMTSFLNPILVVEITKVKVFVAVSFLTKFKTKMTISLNE